MGYGFKRYYLNPKLISKKGVLAFKELTDSFPEEGIYNNYGDRISLPVDNSSSYKEFLAQYPNYQLLVINKELQPNQFKDCDTIKEVLMGPEVVEIPFQCFYGCANLEKVSISNKVTFLTSSFTLCTKLRSISFGSGSNSSASSGSAGIFQGCSSLMSVVTPNLSSSATSCYRDCTGLKFVEIGVGTLTIPNYAFCDCSSLLEIVIPDTVTNIGDFAFAYSPYNQPATIYFKGTQEEWDEISISTTGNNALVGGQKYYYSEEAPAVSGDFWHYVEGQPTIWEA